MSIAACAAVVLAIGWLDVATGPELGLSLLYLVPVALSAWIGGFVPAVLVATLAAAVWLAADLTFRGPDYGTAIALWNAFTRFVIYVSEGVLVSMVRRDRERLRLLAMRESTLARTDIATSLPNTRAFMEIVDAELASARLAGTSVCIVYIDLDHFKSINDRHGHAEGDAVLMQVAEALTLCIRAHDVPARLGGDEFAILLRATDLEGARHVASRVGERVARIGHAYTDVQFGATIGIAHFATLPEDAASALRAADAVMYTGKARGKGLIVAETI